MAAAASVSPCAAAPDAEVARTFLQQLYAQYDDRSFCPTCDGAERFFDRRMLKLFEAVREFNAGGAVQFRIDPVCQCQDGARLRATILSITLPTPRTAMADMELRSARAVRHATLELVVEGGRWRIHDIHTADTPSFWQEETLEMIPNH
jgi:hypothetical protein